MHLILSPVRPSRAKAMRMLMELTIPVEAGNEAGRWDKISEDSRSSATRGRLFSCRADRRAGRVCCFRSKGHLSNPRHSRTVFPRLQREGDILPVMNAEDLAKAMPGIEKAVKEHAQGASA